MGQPVSVEEVAKHLGVTEKHVHRLVSRDALPAHDLGKYRRFYLDEVDAWARNQPAISAASTRSAPSSFVDILGELK